MESFRLRKTPAMLVSRKSLLESKPCSIFTIPPMTISTSWEKILVTTNNASGRSCLILLRIIHGNIRHDLPLALFVVTKIFSQLVLIVISGIVKIEQGLD